MDFVLTSIAALFLATVFVVAILVPPQRKKSLAWGLAGMSVAAAYPLSLLFFSQPITAWLGWSLFIGVVMAALLPLRSFAPQRGAGYLIVLLMIVPFAVEILIGYGIARLIDTPVDSSGMKILSSAYGKIGFLRVLAGIAGAYLAGSLASHLLRRSGSAPSISSTLLAGGVLAVVLFPLFYFLTPRIPILDCYLLGTPNHNPDLAKLKSDNSASEVLLIRAKIPFDVSSPRLITSSGEIIERAAYYSTVDNGAEWIAFAVPTLPTSSDEFHLHVVGFPQAPLPARIETRAGH